MSEVWVYFFYFIYFVKDVGSDCKNSRNKCLIVYLLFFFLLGDNYYRPLSPPAYDAVSPEGGDTPVYQDPAERARQEREWQEELVKVKFYQSINYQSLLIPVFLGLFC